jgi:hypothetical protein
MGRSFYARLKNGTMLNTLRYAYIAVVVFMVLFAVVYTMYDATQVDAMIEVLPPQE